MFVRLWSYQQNTGQSHRLLNHSLQCECASLCLCVYDLEFLPLPTNYPRSVSYLFAGYWSDAQIDWFLTEDELWTVEKTNKLLTTHLCASVL